MTNRGTIYGNGYTDKLNKTINITYTLYLLREEIKLSLTNKSILQLLKQYQIN